MTAALDERTGVADVSDVTDLSGRVARGFSGRGALTPRPRVRRSSPEG